MPAKSKKQFKKMFELHKQGKITQAQLDDFTKGVDESSLPERVGEKDAPRSTEDLKKTYKERFGLK